LTPFAFSCFHTGTACTCLLHAFSATSSQLPAASASRCRRTFPTESEGVTWWRQRLIMARGGGIFRRGVFASLRAPGNASLRAGGARLAPPVFDIFGAVLARRACALAWRL
jgi:hypothetical protein